VVACRFRNSETLQAGQYFIRTLAEIVSLFSEWQSIHSKQDFASDDRAESRTIAGQHRGKIGFDPSVLQRVIANGVGIE